MKNYILLYLLALFLVACDNEEQKNENLVANYITASINGDDFNASVINGFLNNTFSVEVIKIFGTQSSSAASIGFNIAASIGTGPRTVVADDLVFTFSNDLNNSEVNFLTEGTLNIIRNNTTDNIIEGSFNFTATDEADDTNIFTVTDGTFKVTYL